MILEAKLHHGSPSEQQQQHLPASGYGCTTATQLVWERNHFLQGHPDAISLALKDGFHSWLRRQAPPLSGLPSCSHCALCMLHFFLLLLIVDSQLGRFEFGFQNKQSLQGWGKGQRSNLFTVAQGCELVLSCPSFGQMGLVSKLPAIMTIHLPW